MTVCLQKILICFPWGLSNLSKLNLILLRWRKWWAPNNASRWRMGFNSAFKGLNTLLQSYQSKSPNYVFVYKPVYWNWLHLIQDTTSHHTNVFTFMLLSQGRKDKTWESTDRVMFFLVPQNFFFFYFVHEVRHRLLFFSFRYLFVIV